MVHVCTHHWRGLQFSSWNVWWIKKFVTSVHRVSSTMQSPGQQRSFLDLCDEQVPMKSMYLLGSYLLKPRRSLFNDSTLLPSLLLPHLLCWSWFWDYIRFFNYRFHILFALWIYTWLKFAFLVGRLPNCCDEVVRTLTSRFIFNDSYIQSSWGWG